jgi:hypothetical protein
VERTRVAKEVQKAKVVKLVVARPRVRKVKQGKPRQRR